MFLCSGGSYCFLRDGGDDGEKEYVCAIKRCLKSNIRRIYLFCNKGRETRGLKKLLGEFSPLRYCTGRCQGRRNLRTQKQKKKAALYIFFSLSILKTNIFFSSAGRRGEGCGGADFFSSFFSFLFFSSLFSLFFNRCKND